MTDGASMALVFATFLAAGAVKGVIGLGLPTVALAVLAMTLGLPQAMALLVVPSTIANLWQASAGGEGRALLGRLWPFLLALSITVWLGTGILARSDARLLSGLLGLLLIAYAGASLMRGRPRPAWLTRRWAAPLLGAVTGLVTGMTGSFVVPGALYLEALGLAREALVQALGIAFLTATVALALSLAAHGLLTLELGALSGGAVVPTLLGMAAGRKLRRALPQERFRRLFFLGLLVIGAGLALRALG